jgi:predicted N-acetyltransferase YhbS
MKVQIVNELDLAPALDQEIAQLLARAFDTDFGGRSYFRQRHHQRLIARIDGTLAGHVALTYRSIALGGQMFPIIGLAEVATDDAFRGQGVARGLITRAIETARHSNAQFALLFGDPAHYQRYGFEVAENNLRYLELDSGVSESVQTVIDPSFMQIATGDTRWDAQAEIDLMGHMF